MIHTVKIWYIMNLLTNSYIKCFNLSYNLFLIEKKYII